MTDSPSREDRAEAEAQAWVARLSHDGAGGGDGLAFDAWLDAAPGNRAAYGAALALWHEFGARANDILTELDGLPDGESADLDVPPAPAWSTPSAAPRRAARRSGARLPMRRWLPVAAGAALAAGLALAVLPPAADLAVAKTYTTAKGQHQRIALGDGSVIDLDAESRLSVSLSGAQRRVTLAEGQAIFDVVHDAKRPFVVRAAGRDVRDIGTQFDVKARDGQLTVTVARGRVAISADAGGPGRPVELGPGQRFEADPAGPARLTAVDPQETFSWRAGRLVYRAQPLSEVVADLNRQFIEQTEIADPTLAKLPITGVIVLDNPHAVMSRLSLMLPIRTVPSGKGLMLLRK
ncbi:FecR family protein [Phenylobacterium sp.]|uniref:FecR family protein n=1 Tax=Phenylobacterium sp. TaxID=1871053 RepID=UPI0025D82830|nr:FecR domain-containing protein [Phenylobacterium sp.]